MTGQAQPLPDWIWTSTNAVESAAHFRASFTAPPDLIKAVLIAAADDAATAFLNGTRVAAIVGTDRAAAIDLTPFLRPGTNLIALSATNQSGPAALAVMLEMVAARGRPEYLLSGTNWLASPTAPAGWNQTPPAIDPWERAVSLGRVGLEPWGNPFDPRKSFNAYDSWKLALGTNSATASGTLTLLPGFRAELLRSALPGEGSWIALAFDPEGRITIAREKRGLLRFTLEGSMVSRVEVINDTLLECRGLLYAHGSLYANANNSKSFVRLRDTDGDGTLDEIRELLRTGGGVGHGRNHVVPGPDGALYLVHGNNVNAPTHLAPTSPLRRYENDRLIPCPWDDRLFDGDVLLPAGHILHTDAKGSSFELIAGGFRNPLDLAFNEDGEMFTFDADMEWDVGLPWYRPNRVNHVVSGADYGWRRGTAKFPDWFPETLPSTLDIGLASPTAVEFGYASRFPARYRRALYICDWAYGRILAIHLRPRGASYTATQEAFISGRPLNVTDLRFGPDGAMYFTTGGRGTQSGLYRVTFSGTETPEPPLTSTELAESRRAAELRELRRRLEVLHRVTEATESSNVIASAWPHLGHEDPFIRHAARVAVEHQDARLWQARALTETNLDVQLTALLALARVVPDEARHRILTSLHELPLERLTETQALVAYRAWQIALMSCGAGDAALLAAARRKLEPQYPAVSTHANHLLCELLVHLGSTNVIPATLGLLGKAERSEDFAQYLFYLRYVREGWTTDRRAAWFRALSRAEQLPGARSYAETLREIRKEMLAAATPEERLALEEAGRETPMPLSPVVAFTTAPRRHVRDWRMEDLVPHLDQVARGRSFVRARTAVLLAQCGSCHRIGREFTTGLLGPDLTAVASRFSRRDLVESVLHPSRVVEEKYRQVEFRLNNGDSVTGSIDFEDTRRILVRTGPAPADTRDLAIREIVKREPSILSPMPEGLLNTLEREEILDLLAYLEAGGDSRHPAFQP